MHTLINKLKIYIHWLTLILIILTFIFIENRGAFGRHTLFSSYMKNIHFYTGFLILFITIIRIFITPFISSSRKYGDSTSEKLQRILAKYVHIFLYIWLIVMCIMGWCIISAKEPYASSIPFNLPAILPIMSDSFHHEMESIHGNIAYIGLCVIFLHAIAALYNHYILRNNVLRNISPFKKHRKQN